MVALRTLSLLPLVPEGLDVLRGGGVSWKLGDNMSDERRAIPGDGGRSFRVLRYGDGGLSGCREGDLGGAIIPSEELRLVAGRMRGR